MDEGKLVGGVWLPTLETHLNENMEHGSDKAWRSGKLTYQTYKLDAAMLYQQVDRRRTCIDIGAHVGLWTMWLAELFDEVHAFEPLADQHEHLFHKNVPADNVTFHPYAMGDCAGKVRMKMRPEASCTSFISRDALSAADAEKRVRKNMRTDGEHKVKFEIVEVDMRTLDSFEIGRVDFMKIDTEGFELYVVNGGLETIKRCKPNIVLEQHLDVYYGHEPKAALRVLEGLGMTCKEQIGPDHIVVWE